ncbi:YrhB domain-containing protein [Streptomyces sp. NPDC018045]|uniref:YrhB domain-containing protein n=1 Tax=Streptomyces sp. NPDC018045 TaxID=3365037 RepID=UPI0037A4A4EA
MMTHAEAVHIAEEQLAREAGPYDPPMAIDSSSIEEREGMLIVPFNSIEYLETGDPMKMLLDCFPTIVDLSTGEARMGTLADLSLFGD